MARKFPSSKQVPSQERETEHGTVQDVEKLFGISRHVCIQKVRDGTFQSMMVCEAGSRKPVRLVYLDSVRRYLRRQQTANRYPGRTAA